MKNPKSLNLACIFITAFVSISGVSGETQKPEKHSWTLGYTPDRTIQFSEPESGDPLNLDLFLPPNHEVSEKRPCIVFFFGGGWSGGDTKQFFGFSKYLASRGIIAVSAQYRTKSSHGATPNQCVEDGKKAIRYLRRHADELGIDPDQVIAGGGSAGGHVAAALAMCPKIDAFPNDPITCLPNALVLLNPVYDNGPGGYGHERVTDYWQDISPLHNIRSGLPPTIVFFGSNDKHVPVATADAFQASMIAAGNECETHVYEGQSHGFFHISKGGRKMFEDVLVKIDAFLVEHHFLTGEDTVAIWTAESVDRL